MFLEVVMLAVEVSSTNEVVAVGFRAAPLVRFFQKYNLPKDVLPVTELQSIPKFFREIRSVREQKSLANLAQHAEPPLRGRWYTSDEPHDPSPRNQQRSVP